MGRSNEDYPGQQREIEIEAAIKKAIEAADRIILDASDGSVEETNYLTMRVAEGFADKVACGVTHSYTRKLLHDRMTESSTKVRSDN